MANKDKIIKTLGLSSVLLFFMLIVASLLGFGKGGFAIQQIFDQFNLYLPYGLGGLFLILIAFFVSITISKDDSQYGNSIGFADGNEFPAIKSRIFNNQLGLYILSTIFFMSLGILSFTILSQQSFTGIGQLEQQFTEFDNLLFSFSLIATAENLGAGAFFAFLIIMLRFYGKKNELTKANYVIFYFALAILSYLIFGVINHLLRYGGSEIDLFRVAGFWAITGLITAFSGSIIPGWVMHQQNNLFVGLKDLFSNEVVLIMSVVFIVLLSIVYFNFFFKNKKGNS